MMIAITYPITTGRSFRCVARRLLALFGRRVQVLAPRILSQPGPQETDRQERQPVERDSHPFGVGVLQGVGDEPGRERQEGHHQQKEQVEPQEDRICCASRSVNAVWASHAAPIVRKLTT